MASIEELMAIAGPPDSGGGGATSTGALSVDQLVAIAGPPEEPEKYTNYDLIKDIVTGNYKPTGQDAANMMQSAGESGRNVFTSAANFLGFADEGGAKAREVIGKAQGAVGLEPSYQDYDTELAAIRGGEKQFAEEHPVADVGAKLAAGIGTAGMLPSPSANAKGFWPAFKALIAEGAGYGGFSGFANAEGGLENRAESGAKGAGIGAAGNLIIGGALRGIGNFASRGSDDTLKQALDIQRSELEKAAKFSKKGAENPLMKAVRGADDRGVFSIGDDAKSFIAKNEAKISEFGDEVSNILEAAPRAETVPEFSRAAAEIKGNPFQATALKKQFNDRFETLLAGAKDPETGEELVPGWDGTLAGLNKFKQYLYKIAYKGTTDSQDLDKAFASDIRDYIEKEATNLLGDDAGGEIAKLNRLQGEHLQIRKQLDKIDAKDNMSGGLGLAIRRAAISPIGGAAGGALYGLYTGNDTLGNAAKGAALGLAATRGGQLAVSRALKPVGSALTGASAKGAIPALNSVFNKQEEKQMDALPPNVFSPPAIQEKASVFEVPKKLMNAVKQVESSNNANAVGPQTKYGKARGAYQMLDATGKEYHKKLGIKEPYDPHNEAQQEKLATAYIADLLKKYKGDITKALTAYHTGPGNVDKGEIGPQGKVYAGNVLKAVKDG